MIVLFEKKSSTSGPRRVFQFGEPVIRSARRFHWVPNFLGVNASVDENHVYLLTKTMYENLPFLQAIHPATKVMAVEKAMAGLPIPLHPGAAKYYKEMGMAIPSHLVSK